MRIFYIFGIKFFDGSPDEILETLKNGGVLVAPSGPGLSTIKTHHQYLLSLQQSTVAIFDSGLLCLLLRLKNMKVQKLSGLKFLIFYLSYLSRNQHHHVLMVNPSAKDGDNNHQLLINKFNLSPGKILNYTAPLYKPEKIEDDQLVSIIKQNRPEHIIINIGGGTQEILANHLINQISKFYRPTIICTGAAIAFLTGSQAKIPSLIDRLYLGWFARCCKNPRHFIPRYFKSLNLIKLALQEKVQSNVVNIKDVGI